MKAQNHKEVLAACLAAFALFAFLSCKKENNVPLPEPAHPVMHYTDFKNAEVVEMQRTYVDIDADGRTDFFFEIIPVADPVLNRTRLLFYVYSKGHTALLIADPDRTPALRANETVKADFAGFEWWEVSAPVLAEEIKPNNADAHWDGAWKDASPAYLPLRLQKGGQHYFGWLQMTLDKKDRKLILHKAGLSTEAGKAVKAGK